MILRPVAAFGSGPLVLMFLLVLAALDRSRAGQVTLTLRDAATGQPMPGRFHLKDAAGKPQRADPLPFWFDHFVCDGTARLDLAPGAYGYTAERGPEFSSVSGSFTVKEDGAPQVMVELHRLADLAGEGWWSGETHVHRPIRDVELLLRAEDLHVAEVISWWNKVNPWTNTPLPEPRPVRFDHNRFYHPLGGEDERDGGALLFFNLERPLPITGGARHFPSSLVFAEEARLRPGAWIDIEKPFWWDLPMWVAHGVGASIGLANNHQQRDGMLDNEAWGRARDRAALAGPRGNGLWTQQIYYHLLNTGVRLAPSAGSASGVLPNPVGYDRVYVQLDGELSYEQWCAGLRAGRSFVSNGPLLRARANSQWPGHVFTTQSPLSIRLEGRLDSREPIERVELIRNGRVEPIQLPATFTMSESGWFLVRAIAAVTNTFRFACTAPWYVEVGGQPMRPQPEAARFFVDWCRERIRHLETLAELAPGQKQAVLEPWHQALAYWQEKQRAAGMRVTGNILDAVSGRNIPARLYVQDEAGHWFFPVSAAADGSAVRYERQATARSIEKHTTLSAHPFQIDLPAGRYRFTAERGKEYLPVTNDVVVGSELIDVTLRLRRWVDMAGRGWYSGDAHVHREPRELANVLLAEDVNVVLPMVYWTTADDVAPDRSPKNFKGDFPAQAVTVDATHLYYPRNTEYEIFTTAKKSHPLGALVVVNHRTIFDVPVWPLRQVAQRAHAQGALIDLEKHNWEWSMAIVPIVRPDLYELANNHHWRTEFAFTNWAVPAPAWMKVGHGRDSERDWTLYGFQNYYALLNCGFRLRPSAGTANGVHPVPLGYSRVYVQVDGPFSYASWIKGLAAGRSFVTTGPMLLATFDGADPGKEFERRDTSPRAVTIQGSVLSETPVGRVELIVNGQITRTIELRPDRTPAGSYTAKFRQREQIPGNSWVAARCWEQPTSGRWRFAHTGPVYFDIPGRPPHPRREEAEFLANRVREELERSRSFLTASAIAEYEESLRIYEGLVRQAVRAER